MNSANFSQRRAKVLTVFNQAVTELHTLNEDIETNIQLNQTAISDLQQDTEKLKQLKSDNNRAIKFFSKIFKTKTA